MRTSLKALYGFALIGPEEEIGMIEDFYVDDTSWRVKFMVVDTGEWLTSRRVVTSIQSVEDIDCESSMFHTRLTKEQIEESPNIDTGKHMGPEHEGILVRHYHLNPHWPEAGMFGIPPFLPPDAPICNGRPDTENQDSGIHLVVTSEVMGWAVEATDGHLGILHDLIVLHAWQVREVEVKTGGHLMGKKVLIPLSAIASLNWGENIIRLNISREMAKKFIRKADGKKIQAGSNRPGILRFLSSWARRGKRPRYPEDLPTVSSFRVPPLRYLLNWLNSPLIAEQ